MNLEKAFERQNALLKSAAEHLCCINTNINNIPGTERIQSFVTTAEIIPDVNLYTGIIITSLDDNLYIANHVGTALEMYPFVIRIKDSGDGPYDITWDTEYRAIGVTLPITIDQSKTMYIGMIWNAYDSTFDVTSVMIEM